MAGGAKKTVEGSLSTSLGEWKSDGFIKVKRGRESWDFLYIILGFALTVEGTVISMMTPVRFPWNLALYFVMAAVTVVLFLTNGWLQNRLIRLKIVVEEKNAE